MKIGIVGQGFVGRALHESASNAGHIVVGIEVDHVRIKTLMQAGILVSSNFSLLNDCEIIVIAVPTPLDNFGSPDLSKLIRACKSIKKFVSSSTLIVNESTSYPGTLRNIIAPIFEGSCLFASAPERVDPGNNFWGLKNTPRIVSGLTPQATTKALNFYKSFSDSVIEVASPEVAESAKLFENTFRQVNIALVNEFAQIATKLGVSAFEVLDAAATKPFGFMSFLPSVGVGGHCIPVDPIYLSYIAGRVGVNASMIEAANKVNLNMPEFVASRIEECYGVKGKKIQVAGISYKPGIADTREAPAVTLINALRSRGANVIWSDSFVSEYCGEVSVPISKVDIGIICTAHPAVDYSSWMNGTIVVDVSTGRDTGWPKLL